VSSLARFVSCAYKEDGAGKRGRFCKKKSAQKIQKEGRREQKKPTTHTYTHKERCFLRAHSYHAKEPTEEESETKRNLNDAPRPYFCLFVARALAMDVRPVRPSVGCRRPVNFSFFFSLGSQKIPPLSQKSVGSSFGKGVALYARFTTRVDSSTRKKTKRTKQTRVELSFGTDFTSRNRRERRERMRNVPFFASFFLPARLRYLRVIFSRSLQLCSRVRATFFF